MSWAPGSQFIRASKEHNEFVKLLVKEGFAESGQQVIELALALGLRSDARAPVQTPAQDMVPIARFDTEGIFSAVLLAKYSALPEEGRVLVVNEHVAAGLEKLIEHFTENGQTMDFGSLLAQNV